MTEPLLSGTYDGARLPPLVAHIIFSLDVGGLENGLVNLINHLPEQRFRHAVICLTGYTDFRLRIRRNEVTCYSLDKPAGIAVGMYYKLWRLLRKLQPDIVHTRNLAALEGQLPAALAGVPIRIHGEHGREMNDLDGGNKKYQWLRRLHKPLVHHYVALSRDLESYLCDTIGIAPDKISQIYNGVDTTLFSPVRGARGALPCPGFDAPDLFIIGTVGRMQEVKNQLTLARAFILLLAKIPNARAQLRLVMVGDGPLRAEVQRLLQQAGVCDLAWLPGVRDDIPEIMRELDVFVLPSLAEGISNTVLEAMASGLPVVATRVGGNPELVETDGTGWLVPPGDPEAMAEALHYYFNHPEERARHGAAARAKVRQCFSIEAMARNYMRIYDRLIEGNHQRLNHDKGQA